MLADLIASGYCDHMLTLELSRCRIGDDGLQTLATALVGNAPYLQYLGLNGNPITSAGIQFFAACLSPRRLLTLPLLRWLHCAVAGMGDAGALALAACLHAAALPSLEVLWTFTDAPDVADPGLGAVELAIVCTRRRVELELGTVNGVLSGVDVLSALPAEVATAAMAAWEHADDGLDGVD